MASSPLTHNPIPVGGDGAAMAGVPTVPQAAVAPAFPEPGRRTAKALQELAKCEQQQGRWQVAVLAKRAEFEDLERRAGADVLDAVDEEQDQVSEKVSRQLAALRDGIEVARRTAETAEAKVVEARRAVLKAEAADLRDLLGEARRRQSDHDAKLRRLLDQVEALDGAQYRPQEPVALQAGTVAMGQGRAYTLSRAAVLAREVSRLELMVRIADAAAAGEQLPVMEHSVPIPGHMFSPRVRGPLAFAEVVAG